MIHTLPKIIAEMQSSYGTVQPGKIADLVLLRADPLSAIENTRQIETVVRAGRLLGRASLDETLSKAAARIQGSTGDGQARR